MRRATLINRKKALQVVKELDAFPKVPDSYQETTPSGGGVSIIVFGFILVLVVSEVRYYTASELKYEYEVDRHFDEKLKINIDMTVAMKCNQIGADILDLTGQNADTFGALEEEPVHFEMSSSQRRYFDMAQHINEYFRKEYHAIHDFLWQTGFTGMSRNMPSRDEEVDKPHDACRLRGSLTVNKVAGNFHVTAGKSIPVIPKGHAHLAIMVRDEDYNFSHRIEQFSFGDVTPGIINPLDAEEKIVNEHYHMFQYFIQVVPTRVTATFSELDTFQYAVTEKNRTINHSEGSHGVPGIFVKYDLSPIKVRVREDHKPYWQFLVRLCGIIGGVFATSGMIHHAVGFLTDCVCCKYHWGKYNRKNSKLPTTQETLSNVNLTEPPVDTIPGVSLLSNDIGSPTTALS